MAQLEHQAVRIENLELMAQYGTNAWKVYNEYVFLKNLFKFLASEISKATCFVCLQKSMIKLLSTTNVTHQVSQYQSVYRLDSEWLIESL